MAGDKGVQEAMKKLIKDEHVCYVLITCAQPSAEGNMRVELTYEGDPTLAAYLIESAQDFLPEEE